jgi:hypothetical protein
MYMMWGKPQQAQELFEKNVQLMQAKSEAEK